MSIKPCTIGPRHTWAWVKNFAASRMVSSNHGRVTLKGLYKCQCGQRKEGKPKMNDGGDPFSIGGAA